MEDSGGDRLTRGFVARRRCETRPGSCRYAPVAFATGLAGRREGVRGQVSFWGTGTQDGVRWSGLFFPVPCALVGYLSFGEKDFRRRIFV